MFFMYHEIHKERDYVTVICVFMSSFHSDLLLYCMHITVSLSVSVSAFLSPFSLLKSLIKSSCNIALLIHALFSSVAACETRGWGLLSPPLIVSLSVYYFVICWFSFTLSTTVWLNKGEACRRWVGWKLVGQFIILFLPCQVKTLDCSSLSQRAVITIGKQLSRF